MSSYIHSIIIPVQAPSLHTVLIHLSNVSPSFIILKRSWKWTIFGKVGNFLCHSRIITATIMVCHGNRVSIQKLIDCFSILWFYGIKNLILITVCLEIESWVSWLWVSQMQLLIVVHCWNYKSIDINESIFISQWFFRVNFDLLILDFVLRIDFQHRRL